MFGGTGAGISSGLEKVLEDEGGREVRDNGIEVTSSTVRLSLAGFLSIYDRGCFSTHGSEMLPPERSRMCLATRWGSPGGGPALSGLGFAHGRAAQ